MKPYFTARHLTVTLLMALAYFLAAKLGLELATINQSASPIWPAAGLAVGFLLVFGFSFWPAILIGAFGANLLTSAPLLSTFAISLGNTAEAVIGAATVLYLLKRQQQYPQFKEALSIIAAGTFAPLFSATIGCLSLMKLGSLPGEQFFSVWLTWWIGDSLGILIVTPLMWFAVRQYHKGIRPSGSDVLLFAANFALAVVAFRSEAGSPLLFVAFLPLLFNVARDRECRIFFLALTTSAVGVWATVKHLGPFVDGSTNDNLVLLQVFMSSFAMSALILNSLSKIGPFRMGRVIMFCTWALAAGMYHSFSVSEQEKDAANLDTLVGERMGAVRNRLDAYEESLRSGASLFAASNDVNYMEWKGFVEHLSVTERLPGIRGLGIARRVSARDLPALVRETVRQSHQPFIPRSVPGYEVVEGEDQYISTQVEPKRENSPAVGLIISSEPRRKAAAELARDTGKAAVTTSIVLVQDNERTPGMLVFYPIYKNGAPTQTVAQRRLAVIGWVFAPMTWKAVLEGVLGQNHKELNFEMFESLTNGNSLKLYDSDDTNVGKPTDRTATLTFAQKKFTLVWSRASGFHSAHDTIGAWVALLATLLGLLLACVVTILRSTQQKAETIAEQAILELRTNEEKFRSIIQNVKDYSIVILDVAGFIKTWNAGAEHITGYPARDVIGQSSGMFYLPEERKAGLPEAHLKQLIDTGRFESEGWRQKKDGTRYWSEVIMTAIHDSSGRLQGFSEIVRDLTARKEAEDERTRLIEILDASPDFIGIADIRGKLLYSNAAAKKMIGADIAADLSRKKIKTMFADWAGNLVVREGIPAVLKHGMWRKNTALKHQDGHEVPVSQVIMLHTDSHGAPRYMSTIMRDMTEDVRRSNQEALAQRIDRFLATANSESEILNYVTAAIARHLKWKTSIFWKTNADATLLEFAEFYAENDERAREFCMRSREYSFKFGMGMPGRIWQNRRIDWLEDARTQGNFLRKDLAAKTGMISGFGFPLYIDDEFMGCFEFFTDEHIAKDENLVSIFKDVQKRIAQRIQFVRSKAQADQNHQMLQAIIDGYPGPVQVKSLEGRFLMVNQVLADTFAMPKERLLGATLDGLVPQEAIDVTVAEEQEIFRTGDSKLIEKTVHIRGADRTMLTHKFPLRDLDGNITMICGITTDLSEQAALKGELQRSTEWRRAMLDSANVTMISTDPDGVIQSFNRRAELLLGYTEKELVGIQTPGIFHVPAEVAAHAEMLSQELGREIEPGFQSLVLKSTFGKADENEWTYIRKDGTTFPVSLTVTTLRSDSGEITGYLGIGNDITEHREAQAKLHQSERRLKYALEGSSDGMWDWDLVKQEIYVSEKLAKLFGGPQLIHLSNLGEANATVHPEDVEKTQKSLLAHLRGETETHEVEARLRTASGNYRWMLTRGKVSERDEHGRPTRMTGVHIDIATMKQAEQELRHAEIRALEAVKAKDQFLASMSHEIRTPLNGIIGMTDLMLETKLTTEQREYALIAQQSGTSLLAIINDILDFSKIEAGKMTLEKTDFSVVQLIEAQAEILLGKAKQKGLSLSTYASPHLPEKLEGDPGRVGQIILNLIGNAMKFTAKGGVAVRARELANQSVTAGAYWVRIEVQDTGIGLSETAQQKLFRPFSQADETISRKYGGTGLGLSICKRLVDAMGGRIGIDSQEGVGSTFWFEIPLKTSNLNRGACLYDELTPFQGERVLLMEPDSNLRETAQLYIKSWGMQHDSVSDTPAAISHLQAAAASGQRYRVAIIGANASLDQALSTGRDIKAALGDEAPDLILAAEFGQKMSHAMLAKYGFAHLINKPFKQSQLFDTLASSISPTLVGTTVEPSAARLAEKQAKAHLRVLVADDVAANQLLARKILENLGYSVTVAANGVEVLELLKTVRFDLILMDCQMPEMDGFEATRNIRNHERVELRDLPIIALTANAMAGDDKICIAAGMNDYLAKPIKKEQIRVMLERWLNSKVKSAA